MPEHPRYLAVHAEMQDASHLRTPVADAPAAAGIELAKLLNRFESEIDDEWRATLIHIGGGLIRLDRQLTQRPG